MAAASKYLSNLVYSYKGMGLSMVRPLGWSSIEFTLTAALQGTMICGWDKTVCSRALLDED